MIQTILNTAITTLVGVILGYCVSTIKKYREKIKNEKDNENIQNVALKIILQSQLTNTYIVYQKMGEIPDYVYKNWLNMLSIYKKN